MSWTLSLQPRFATSRLFHGLVFTNWVRQLAIRPFMKACHMVYHATPASLWNMYSTVKCLVYRITQNIYFIPNKYKDIWTMWSFLTINSISSPLALEQQYQKWLVMSGTHSFSASLPFLSATWKKNSPQNVILYRMPMISPLISQYFVIKQYLSWLLSLSSQPCIRWWFGANWATSLLQLQNNFDWNLWPMVSVCSNYVKYVQNKFPLGSFDLHLQHIASSSGFLPRATCRADARCWKIRPFLQKKNVIWWLE